MYLLTGRIETDSDDSSGTPFITVDNATFEWKNILSNDDQKEDDEKNVENNDKETDKTELTEFVPKTALSGISFKADEKTRLIMVTGKVGSGKTTLIQALLGLLNRTAGSVSMSGSIAYVSQTVRFLKESQLNGY